VNSLENQKYQVELTLLSVSGMVAACDLEHLAGHHWFLILRPHKKRGRSFQTSLARSQT
jgi:hypothetical protein